ncbi:zinc transporter 2 [Trichuris trichiura]|uniref:Zinc transporter 2 n=1 Tax=Trichuris trichiura TaxID=36087 RepID=A0A077YW75_TRITR|nr:zinc transporter 2 [Trichuris trichiura]
MVEVDDGLSEDIIPNYKSADAVSAYSSTDYENMVDGSDSQLSFISVHCHKTAGDDKADYGARKALLLSMLLCVIFMTAEIVGGYLAGSLAIITDAAHLLTDLASFLISLFSMYMASREATRKLSFGWHRAEVLGALVSVILIWLITGILVYIAAERIIYNDFDIDARIMLILAAVGVIVNFVMGTVLQLFGGHGHSHGQSVNYSRSSSQTRRNINVRAAFIHVLGDFIQSVGVLVAALIIFFHLQIIDPICTFIFSLLVLATTVHIMKDVVNVLMEGSPRGIDFTEVIRKLGDINGVAKVHDLRIWSLTMDKIAVSVHLAIYREQNAQEVLLKATTLLRDQYHVFECTVQIEHFSEDMQGCQRCEPPKR